MSDLVQELQDVAVAPPAENQLAATMTSQGKGKK